MNILLINDGKECSNWGLQASSAALIDIFKKNRNVNIETIPHNKIHQKFSFDPYIFGKKLFNEQSRTHKFISKNNLLIPTTADQYELYSDLWIRGNGGSFSKEILVKIEKSDCVFFNAEGSTYRKNFGSLAGLFLLYLSSFKFNKKAIFINGSFTISSVDNVLSGIAKKLYKNNIQFYVREPLSMKDLERINIKSTLIPDSVFYYSEKIDNIYKKSNNDLSNYFAVSKSMLPMIQDSFCKDKLDAYLEIIIKISEKSNLSPIFLVKDREDKSLIGFKKYLKTAKVANKDYSFSEIQNLISKCNFLISGRYHHLIFACNTSTNICCLSSSSHKIEGLAKLISDQGNMEIPVFDPTNIRAENKVILDYCLEQSINVPSWQQNYFKIKLIDGVQKILSEI